MDEYQEQSYLLDPYLEELVTPLARSLRKHVQAFEDSDNPNYSSWRVWRLSQLLYHFIKLRGYKTIGESYIRNSAKRSNNPERMVVRFFPHEVGDLSVVLMYMSAKTPYQEENQWSLRYVVLLWMSLICMLPFDLNQFDEVDSTGQTAKSIEEAARCYLDVAGLERDGASIVLSRLFMRWVAT
jgi:hypothetical protein